MFARPHPTTASAGYRPASQDGHVDRTVITSDGVRLAIRDYGSADACDHTVVLLHGLLLTQESWAAQVRQLRRRWGSRVRIITYDHRGHGRSTGASMHSYTINRLAADLAEVLTALWVTGPLTLAGHSMGGMTALAYLGRPAAERPVDPHGLVLVATAAGRLTQRGLGRLLGTPATKMLFELVHRMPHLARDRAIQGLTRPVRKVVSRYSGHDSAEGGEGGLAAVAAAAIRSISLATATGFLPSLQRYDQYHTLESIAARTIVVSGGTDMTTPACHARDLAAAIPGAVHLHRPKAGHMLLQEEPHCVSTAINRAIGTHRRSVHAVRTWASRTSSLAPELAAVAS